MVLDIPGRKEPSTGDLISLNVAKIIEKHAEDLIFRKSSQFTGLQEVKRTTFNFKNFGFIFGKSVYFFKKITLSRFSNNTEAVVFQNRVE